MPRKNASVRHARGTANTGVEEVSEHQEEVAMASSAQHHPLVQLATATIAAYVSAGRVLPPEQAPAAIEGGPAGVFVTLHSRSTGELRGCIGTIEPCEASLAEETIRNAIAAATRDPRFPPVHPEELSNLVIDVSVLYPPEPIKSIEQLDPRHYGVIVQHGRRRGLLLPDIPGIDDARTQVDFARQKAWLTPDEPVDMFRFKVEKYT
jgi:AmmeMemoRadiSam system protein A